MIRFLAVLGALLLLAAPACQSAPSPNPLPVPIDGGNIPAPDVPPAPPDLKVPGTFLYAKEGNLWSVVQGGSPRKLTSFDSGNFPAFPAVSPDGKQVAFSMFAPSQDANDPGGTDLYLMDADGSNPRLLLAHDLPGSSLEAPVWSPDGQMILYTYRAQIYRDNRFVGEVLRLERIAPSGGSRTPVVENASHASYFSDGKRLAYIVTDLKTYGQSLWVANADGSSPRELVNQGQFTALFAPRPSPDGQSIVFGATGEAQTGGGGGASDRGASLLPSWVAVWLPLGTAYAHGVPWDLWSIQSDGGSPRRLTTIYEDTPYPVWLPGGDSIVFLGEYGLYIVSRTGQELFRLNDEFGGIGLTWIPQ